jgi:hypothetical protein
MVARSVLLFYGLVMLAVSGLFMGGVPAFL